VGWLRFRSRDRGRFPRFPAEYSGSCQQSRRASDGVAEDGRWPFSHLGNGDLYRAPGTRVTKPSMKWRVGVTGMGGGMHLKPWATKDADESVREVSSGSATISSSRLFRMTRNRLFSFRELAEPRKEVDSKRHWIFIYKEQERATIFRQQVAGKTASPAIDEARDTPWWLLRCKAESNPVSLRLLARCPRSFASSCGGMGRSALLAFDLHA
jgi:hypothetical protein